MLFFYVGTFSFQKQRKIASQKTGFEKLMMNTIIVFQNKELLIAEDIGKVFQNLVLLLDTHGINRKIYF